MEAIFISAIIGFIGGNVLMFFMKDRLVQIDNSLHAKVDAIPGQIATAANQLASHVTQAVSSIAPKAPPQ